MGLKQMCNVDEIYRITGHDVYSYCVENSDPKPKGLKLFQKIPTTHCSLHPPPSGCFKSWANGASTGTGFRNAIVIKHFVEFPDGSPHRTALQAAASGLGCDTFAANLSAYPGLRQKDFDGGIPLLMYNKSETQCFWVLSVVNTDPIVQETERRIHKRDAVTNKEMKKQRKTAMLKQSAKTETHSHTMPTDIPELPEAVEEEIGLLFIRFTVITRMLVISDDKSFRTISSFAVHCNSVSYFKCFKTL